VHVARRLVGVVSHVRGLQKFKIQSEAEKRYYEKTIDRGMYAVFAQPSACGVMGVGEVRHLWHVQTAHQSGEPREDIIAPRVGGGGVQQPPWAPLSMVARRGGPHPPKSPPSPPRGNGSYVSRGATGRGAQTSW
jgi:hypothetical protein